MCVCVCVCVCVCECVCVCVCVCLCVLIRYLCFFSYTDISQLFSHKVVLHGYT